MGTKINKYSKLTNYDMMTINACLVKHQSLSQIARTIGCSPSTIYREITSNCKIKSGKDAYLCSRLKNSSSVCNKCPKVMYCHLSKRFYDYSYADQLANNRKTQSRMHIKLALEVLNAIDEVVTPAVKKGQGIHHIYVSNPDLQNYCCERTIRRLIYNGYLSCRPHELRRFVRMKRKYAYPRKPKEFNVVRLDGRTFQDFTRLTSNNKRLHVVQFDSVEGKKTDKQAILTITFPESRFQFGILYKRSESCTEVVHKLKLLFSHLGLDLTKKIFPVCLCDNGVEFSRFYKIETNSKGEKLLKTFYTNPYRSTDKAACERNHEFIRYIIPKGHSLDFLTQEKVELMFSHINSYVRKANKEKSPYELIVRRIGTRFIHTINCEKIKPNNVLLKPKLLK